MELKLFFSGVPKGENIWAPPEEKRFLGTLYSTSKVNRRFDITLRNNGRGNYAYYHYLIYNIIQDVEGRSGSYFGMTLRLNDYCPDIKSLYYVLDMIFRKVVVGDILKDTNGILQYKYFSFEDVADKLKNMEKSVMSMLSPILTKADITPIKKIPELRGITLINLSDATDKGIMACFSRNTYCSISEEYPSRREEGISHDAFNKGSNSRQQEIDSLSRQLSLANKKNEELEQKSNPQSIALSQQPLGMLSSTDNNHHQYHYNSDEYEEEPSRRRGSHSTSIIIGIFISFISIIVGVYYFSSSSVVVSENGNGDNSQYFSSNTSIQDLLNAETADGTSNEITIENCKEDSLSRGSTYLIKVENYDDEADTLFVAGTELKKTGDATVYEIKPMETSDSVAFVVAKKIGDGNVYILNKKVIYIKK